VGYPRQVQTLIVEDNAQKRRDYESIFQKLKTRGGLDIAIPEFATCHDDGRRCLESNRIYHLVILDLGLPQQLRGEEQPGVEPGLDLVECAASREAYPVPVLLVISARLALAKTGFNERLQTNFWAGWTVSKNVDDDEAEIARAIGKAQSYCDIGIHIRDAGSQLFPTLSPREEDLLRRSAPKLDCMAFDLEWWSATSGESALAAAGAPHGITKVLMGRYLLLRDNSLSRPTFFKFEPESFARNSHRDAKLMSHKLDHVKVMDAVTSRLRGLLVTQKVGGSNESPLSLEAVLGRGDKRITISIADIASQIFDQLTSLGDMSHDQWPISRLFSKHTEANLLKVWELYAGDREAEPLRVLKLLGASGRLIWVQLQNCTHGDLNIGNIALDSFEDGYKAFLIDGANMRQDIRVRDVAMLEVSLLLQQRSPAPGTKIISECAALYATQRDICDVLEATEISVGGRNTLELIVALRRCALKACDPEVYALAVFDCALLQLGGLYYQIRDNKISDPVDAVSLSIQVSYWLPRVGVEIRQSAGAVGKKGIPDLGTPTDERV
jgi:CheY-like chemotaxis protein